MDLRTYIFSTKLNISFYYKENFRTQGAEVLLRTPRPEDLWQSGHLDSPCSAPSLVSLLRARNAGCHDHLIISSRSNHRNKLKHLPNSQPNKQQMSNLKKKQKQKKTSFLNNNNCFPIHHTNPSTETGAGRGSCVEARAGCRRGPDIYPCLPLDDHTGGTPSQHNILIDLWHH